MLSELRPNILILSAMVALLIIAGHLFGLEVGDSVIAFVGGIIGLAGRLLDPPPPPPEENVPVSALRYLNRKA